MARRLQDLSEIVLEKVSLITNFRHVLRVSLGGIAQKVEAKLRPFLREGETLPDIRMLFILLDRLLESVLKELTAIEHGLAKEAGTLVAANAKLNDAMDDGRLKFTSLRDLFRGNFGKALAQQIGFVERIPVRPMAFREMLRRLIASLEESAPLQGAYETEVLTKEFFISALRPIFNSIHSLIEDTAGDRGESTVAQVTKTKTIRDFDKRTGVVFRVVEHLFRFVGENDLASRLRPTIRTTNTDSSEDDVTVPPDDGSVDNTPDDDGSSDNGSSDNTPPDDNSTPDDTDSTETSPPPAETSPPVGTSPPVDTSPTDDGR